MQGLCPGSWGLKPCNSGHDRPSAADPDATPSHQLARVTKRIRPCDIQGLPPGLPGSIVILPMTADIRYLLLSVPSAASVRTRRERSRGKLSC